MSEQTTPLHASNQDTLAPSTGIVTRSAAVELSGVALGQVIKPKNLETLRFGVRGDDKAVLKIGSEANVQTLDKILTNPSQHTRYELMEAAFVNYSGEAYGDSHWVKRIGAWGDSPEIVTAYGELMNAHPGWVQLSLDPGFMTHLPTFMEMLNNGEVTAHDYKGARNQLKKKLGEKTVWRGTMLTEEEFAKAQTEGLGSPLTKVIQSSEEPIAQFEASAISARPSDAIEKHFHGEYRATPFLSVSEHPEVAIAVGNHFGDKTPGKKFYLFQLSVPVIDLVSYTDHAIKTPSKLRQMQDRNPNLAIHVGINGEETSHKWDDSVESFVFWKIDASEVIDVTQPDISETSWNGQVTKTPAT